MQQLRKLYYWLYLCYVIYVVEHSQLLILAGKHYMIVFVIKILKNYIILILENMWINFCCSLYIFGEWCHNEHPSTLTQVSHLFAVTSVTVFMDHRIFFCTSCKSSIKNKTNKWHLLSYFIIALQQKMASLKL